MFTQECSTQILLPTHAIVKDHPQIPKKLYAHSIKNTDLVTGKSVWPGNEAKVEFNCGSYYFLTDMMVICGCGGGVAEVRDSLIPRPHPQEGKEVGQSGNETRAGRVEEPQHTNMTG